MATRETVSSKTTLHATGKAPPGCRWQVTAVLVLGSWLAAWIAAPPVFRHLTYEEPRFFEVLELVEPIPAGGVAYRDDLRRENQPPAELDRGRARDVPWPPRYWTVTEDGHLLERLRGRKTRERPGSFSSLGPRGVLFSTTDSTDPRSNGRRYQLRRPRQLSEHSVAWLLGTFVTLNALAIIGLAYLVLAGELPRALPAVAIIAIVSFVAVGPIIDSTSWLRGNYRLANSEHQFNRDRDSYDAVFIGSSRVLRQLDPAAFDSVFEEHGLRMRSFNLGEPNMRMLELLTVMRSILRHEPERLRWIIVDCEEEPLRVDDDNFLAERVIRWHALGNLPVVLHQVLFESRVSWPQRLSQAGGHLQATLFHVSHLGQGNRFVERVFGNKRDARPIENRGYFPLDQALALAETPAEKKVIEARYRSLHNALPAYQKLVRRMRSRPRSKNVDPFELVLIERLQQEAHAAGVRVVFLIDARPTPRPNLARAHELGVVETLLRFDDPDRYPELYEARNRWDKHHLNGAKAVDYTRLVAERVLALEQGP